MYIKLIFRIHYYIFFKNNIAQIDIGALTTVFSIGAILSEQKHSSRRVILVNILGLIGSKIWVWI